MICGQGNVEGLVVTTLEDVFTAALLNEPATEMFVEEIAVLDVGCNQCAASTSLV